METVNVDVDDSRTCVGVHWNTTLAAAKAQFSEWGFRGIGDDFHKVSVLNGNDARKKVREIAGRESNVFYYSVGSVDMAVGIKDSAIYRFSYEEFVGPGKSSDPNCVYWSE